MAVINGTPGPDALSGNVDENDSISGEAGNDILYGLSGDDWLRGGTGDDIMAGGLGNDSFEVDTPADSIVEVADGGADTVQAYVNWTLGEHLENLQLYGSANSGTGNEGDNVISGNALNDILTGYAGNDTLNGFSGQDTLLGGLGDDVLHNFDGLDILSEAAGQGTDTVIVGVDYTLGENLENLQYLGLGGKLTGNGEANLITAGSGADELLGLAGADTLRAAGGNDILNGGTGADRMEGGAGHDRYYVDNAGDRIMELAGEGIDRVSSTVNFDMTSNLESLTLFGATAVRGTGTNLANTITGSTANNLLRGLGGDDSIRGEAGDDRLVGGLGRDALAGGAGRDTFDFDAVAETAVGSGRDVVADFVRGTDRIDLATIDANTGLAGDQAFAFVGSALFSGAAGELRVNASGVVQGDVNGDGAADFQIQLNGITALGAADFVL